MNGTQTFILEAGRINSVGVIGGGEDFDNKSSWTNKTPPILLKQGDTVNLQNVLINVGGADTNAIQFQGQNTTPENNIQDNFTLMEIGFYMNHNGIYTTNMPIKYQDNDTPTATKKLQVYTDQTDNNLINNSQGEFRDYSYFKDGGDDGAIPNAQRISRIDNIQSCNPYSYNNGKKYAKIDPLFPGWMRPDVNGSNPNQVNKVLLMTEDIPISIPEGFTAPSAIADKFTQVFSRTNPSRDYDNAAIWVPSAYKYKSDYDVPDRYYLTQYNFDGYTLKCINANLQKYSPNLHRVYTNMAVDEPFQWLYGTEILSNSETDNLKGNAYIPTTLTNRENLEVNYPVLIWNRFIGNDPETFDTGAQDQGGQYSRYSPGLSELKENAGGDDVLLTSGFDELYSTYNDAWRNRATTYAQGLWLAQASSNSYRLVQTEQIGSGLVKFACFVDNDDTNTDLVAWARFYGLSGTWSAVEHEIFKPTNIGGPPGNEYVYNGVDAVSFFQYFGSDIGDGWDRTIELKVPGFDLGTGNKYVENILTDDSDGIQENGEYKISFTLTRTGDDAGIEPYPTDILLSFNGVGGVNQTYNTDGPKEYEFTATSDNYSTNAIQLGIKSMNTGGFSCNMTNISIERENLNTGDVYNLNNVWTSDYTTPQNNKIYSLQKQTSLSSIIISIENNTLPAQGAYTGVNFDRDYKLVARGLVLNYTGGWYATNVLAVGQPADVGLFYDDTDPLYTYWLFQDFSQGDTWYAYRLTKYAGGIPEHGSFIGGNESVGVTLKLSERNGQQYYDFSVGNNWGDIAYPSYNWSSGNTWIDIGGGTNINMTMTSGVAGGLVGQFDFYWVGGGATVYARFDGGVSTAISGTAMYSGDAVPWNRTWSFDINTGINGTLTQMVGVTPYVYTPSQALTATYTPIVFTSHIADPLPLIDTDKEYFASVPIEDRTKPLLNFSTGNDWTHPTVRAIFFTMTSGTDPTIGAYDFFFETSLPGFIVYGRYNPLGDTSAVSGTLNYNNDGWARTWTYAAQVFTQVVGGVSYDYSPSTPIPTTYNSITYYLGANNNGSGDDTDKEGRRGRLIYSTDGGVSYTTATWDWSGGTGIDMNGAYGNIALTTATPPTLTNIIAYDTSLVELSGGLSYSVPTDGKQYGGYENYGTTSGATETHTATFMGCADTTDFDDLLNIVSGKEFNAIGDTFTNPTLYDWSLMAVGSYYQFKIIERATGLIALTLQAGQSQVKRPGWNILTVNKILDTDFTNDRELSTATNVGWITSLWESISDAQVSVSTNGTTGTEWEILSDSSGTSVVDSGLFRNYQNADILHDKANIKQHQLLMTNIKLTDDNLDKIVNWFRYNEIYNGDKIARKEIAADVNKYSIQCDLGRGDDNAVDITHPTSSTNTTGQDAVKAYYMENQGYMGIDSASEPNDGVNIGVICPRRKVGTQENRITIQTRFLDGWEDRCPSAGMYGNKYNYGDKMPTGIFKTRYKTLYDRCVNENIGIVPFIKHQDVPNPETEVLMIGFELYEHKSDGEIGKIQNFTYFGYSPSVTDHNYVLIWNNDAPSVKPEPPDYNWTSSALDQMNYIQIGATQPSMVFNSEVNKFGFRYWHTPTFFNKETGTDTNIGQEVAHIFDDNDSVIFEDYPIDSGVNGDDGRRNVGINDSQSGIFLKDIYYKRTSNTEITSRNDELAIKMTRANFYNTLWFKLGYSYSDLRPVKYVVNTFHDNRFENLSYNSPLTAFRDGGIYPFTTNSLFNITQSPLCNIFSVNSGKSDTENPNKGTPMYGLGFNNCVKASVGVESDTMFPSSIPVNITSGYYRIYTDLPIDTLQYCGSESLAVIGSALLNYASSSQFFFSYGMDYGATITKDIVINSVKIEIRNERGQLIKGLGDRSLIVMKISRAIQLTPPPEDPMKKELDDIEDELKELNQTESKEETTRELNALGAGVGGGDAGGIEAGSTPEEIQDFVNTFYVQLIRNVINRTLIRVQDDPKDIARRIANGLGDYFTRKDTKKVFERLADKLRDEGIEGVSNDPDVRKIIDSLDKFMINIEGKALKGARNQAEVAQTSERGAELLMDTISRALNTNPTIKAGALSAELIEDIGNMIQNTGDIVMEDEDDVIPIAEASVIKGKDEDDPDPDIESKRDEDPDDLPILTQYKVGRGFKPEKREEAKWFFKLSFNNFLKLRLKLTNEDIQEINKSGERKQLNSLYTDGAKFVLQDKPDLFVKTVERFRDRLNDVIGNNDKATDILNDYTNRGSLTGVKPEDPKKRIRRGKKEVEESGEMTKEDKAAWREKISKLEDPKYANWSPEMKKAWADMTKKKRTGERKEYFKSLRTPERIQREDKMYYDTLRQSKERSARTEERQAERKKNKAEQKKIQRILKYEGGGGEKK